MKKLKKAFLIISMVSLLVSCKGVKAKRLIYDYLNYDGPITLWGRKVELSYTEDLPKKVNSLFEDINKDVREETITSYKLHQKVNQLYSLSYDYNRANMEADLYAAMEVTPELFELSNKISNEYTDAIYKMNEVEKTIVKSDKYRSTYLKAYLPNLKGEELERFIEECKNPSNPEIIESQKALSTLQNKERMGLITPYEFLVEFVPLANDYANEKGFDNYLEYLYKNNYGRHYTVNDIVSFSEDTVSMMVPLQAQKQAEYNTKYQALNNEEKSQADKLMRGFFGNNLREFEKYASKLGGAFLRNYNYMMDNGNYFLSAVPNSPHTAYSYGSSTFDTYLFFSRDYQTLDTFVHEFGHYSADFQSGTYNYDMLETQSQGNEMLFSYYLSNMSTINPKVTDVYAIWEENNLINSAVRCTWVNEVETYLYTHEGLSEQQMLDVTNEIAGKYGLYDQYANFNDSYVALVTCGNPGYYISYAVSAMASLSLYALAIDEGFNKAASSYKTIAAIPGNKTFEDMINDASLYNPLTTEGYESITTALSK